MSMTLLIGATAIFQNCPLSSRSDQHVSMFTVQAVMNAMDRDAISGWGAVVHIVEKDKVNFAPF